MSSYTPGFPTYPPPPPPEASLDPRSFGIIFAVVGITMLVIKGLCKMFSRAIQHPDRHDGDDGDAATAAVQQRPPLQPLDLDYEHQRINDSIRGRRRVDSQAPSLPAFAYSRSVQHKVTGTGEEATMCSVCLGAFEHGEMVRLLPLCLHLYHVECIDPWLAKRSSCPVCRSETDPTRVDAGLPPV
ncbi:hypothetical protein ACP4OV_012939 [Aristida adscensionis]